MTYSEKANFCRSRAWSTETWLEQHGRHSAKPWPEVEIEKKERALRFFEAIAADYEKAAKRDAA